MNARKNIAYLLTSPAEALKKAWRVDDDICAAFELIAREEAFGDSTISGDVERLLQKYPSGFAISPEGYVFPITKVMGYNPESKQGLLVVRKTLQPATYKELLNGRK